MAAETFQIKADSLQEARELAKRRILAGFHVLSERVISDGKLMRARGVGKTSAEASANARRNVPSDANIGHESEVSRP